MAHVGQELALGAVGPLGLFPGLPQFPLVLLAPRDVRHGADHARRFALRVAHHVSAVHDARVRPVGAPETVLLRPHLPAALENGIDARQYPLPVAGVDVLLPPGCAGPLFRGIAEHGLDRPVPDLLVGQDVAVPDRLVGGPGDQAVALLALPQRFFGFLGLRDVEHEPLPEARARLLVLDHDRFVAHPDRVPVAVDDTVLRSDDLAGPDRALVL